VEGARPETPIEMLRRHCAMYRYGADASRSPFLSPTAESFISFAGLHLVNTMFITTDTHGGAGGAFHKVLDPLGYSGLLDEVDRVLSLPVGRTTLRQYVRSKRNRLAVHGTLEYESQPTDVRAVTSDEAALEQFGDAMAELDDAVEDLDRQLAALEKGTLPPNQRILSGWRTV